MSLMAAPLLSRHAHRFMARFVCASLLLISALFTFPAKTFCQGETTSSIVGQVNDPTNAAVASATVTIVSTETGQKRTTVTGDSGRFNFPQLKPGTYNIRVEANGFVSQENEAVPAPLGQKQTVNFTLQLAQARQSIQVSGEAP